MRTPALAFLFLAPSLVAQSNAVPGTDVALHELAGITAQYRRGAAYPNGEVGVVVGHSFCNAGSTNIPWEDQKPDGTMDDRYPKIAFLLAQDTGERMVQISGRSFMKHSGTPFNFSSGPCAPCTHGGGPWFSMGCSDTYGTGFNGSQTALGPTTELDPWLGVWDSVGSYFDTGDPSVGGAAAMDGMKSLDFTMVSNFDAVKNRMEVQEPDLVAGGPFYVQAHVNIQGEPVGNRENNIRSQRCSIVRSGSNWNAQMVGSSSYGSVLTKWNGASHATNGNGQDDGRFLVAVKVSGPTGGMYRYEYAIHNLDNSRGGASLRIPVDPAAVVTNFGFHDIDQDAGNDWTASVSAGEIVFAAPASNPHEWNTIYNCWFDCDVAPSFGQVGIDQARPGPGAMTIMVDSQAPSGIPTASVNTIGNGCGECEASFYEFFSTVGAMDLAFTAVELSLNSAGGYDISPSSEAYVFPPQNNLTLANDDETTINLPFSLPYPGGSTTTLRICSNGFISPAASNGTSGFPSTSLFVNGNARWAAAWHDYNPPAAGRIAVDSSPTEVRVSFRNLVPTFGGGSDNFQYVFRPDGTVHYIYRAMNSGGFTYLTGWTPGGVPDPGSTDFSVEYQQTFQLCSGSGEDLTLDASARPVLGTTIDLTTSNLPPSTVNGVVSISFTQLDPAVDLTIIGMPGCHLYGAGNGPAYAFGAVSGTHVEQFMIPNSNGLLDVPVVAQTLTIGTPINDLGILASNGVLLKLGLQ